MKLNYRDFTIEQSASGSTQFDLKRSRGFYKTKKSENVEKIENLGYAISIERCVEKIALELNEDETDLISLIKSVRKEIEKIGQELKNQMKTMQL